VWLLIECEEEASSGEKLECVWAVREREGGSQEQEHGLGSLKTCPTGELQSEHFMLEKGSYIIEQGDLHDQRYDADWILTDLED
jgi:hypothetical protein